MDSLLTAEVIQLCQYQLVRHLIRKMKYNPKFLTLMESNLMKEYQVCQERKANSCLPFEMNCGFTKFFALYVVGMANEASKKGMKSVLYTLAEKGEIKKMMTNALRALFDMPSMNLHFLRYIQPQCEVVRPCAACNYFS